MTVRLREDIRTALPKLRTGQYGALYIDPPWIWMRGGVKPNVRKQSRYTGKSNMSNIGATPYKGMKTADLAALGPELRRVAKPDSHFYLWTVNKTVPDAARLLEAWGWRWVTMITWNKGRPGIAKYFQGMTEHLVFGVRGTPPYRFIGGKMAQGRTLISERMTEHSRKPDAAYSMIQRVSER